MKILTGSGHLSDEAMLLLHESALSLREARRARTHLRDCAACRARSSALRQTDSDLQVERSAGSEKTAQRTLLERRLSEEVVLRYSPRRQRLIRMLQPRTLLQVSLVTAIVAIAVLARRLHLPGNSTAHSYEEMGPRPNPKLTPGSIDTVALSDLCRRSDSDLDPQLAPERVQEVYRSYGINRHAAAQYQVDYLINPQLGGNDNPANLWPEPYSATVWNATAKDELERRLHGMVCSGDLTLSVAQHDIATDWIGAYRKYLHTDRPLPAMASVTTSEAPEE